MNESLQLGRQVRPTYVDPHNVLIDCVRNPRPELNYVARFTVPEFSSLCPVTGAPDFGRLVIDYIPDNLLIESKSLKLFLTAFRNHGGFHEECTLLVAQRLIATAEPRWMRIAAYWAPRGGIPIDVFHQTGAPPDGVLIPALEDSPYRLR